MPNELINLQGMKLKAITNDLNEALRPAIEEMQKAGMTNEEINLEISHAMFDTFRGLHGFPDSHRP